MKYLATIAGCWAGTTYPLISILAYTHSHIGSARWPNREDTGNEDKEIALWLWCVCALLWCASCVWYVVSAELLCASHATGAFRQWKCFIDVRNQVCKDPISLNIARIQMVENCAEPECKNIKLYPNKRPYLGMCNSLDKYGHSVTAFFYVVFFLFDNGETMAPVASTTIDQILMCFYSSGRM